MESDTLRFYDQNAGEFVSGTIVADMSDARTRFTKLLPAKAHILDFGCGSGRDTKAFLDADYCVDATDGSQEICALASDFTGIQVKRMLFNELDSVESYDGIWACASILHLAKDDLADVLRRIERALKPGGVLYASFKHGTFEGVRNGRYFTDFTEKTITEFWKAESSMHIIDLWISQDVRTDRKEREWINLLAKRM